MLVSSVSSVRTYRTGSSSTAVSQREPLPLDTFEPGRVSEHQHFNERTFKAAFAGGGVINFVGYNPRGVGKSRFQKDLGLIVGTPHGIRFEDRRRAERRLGKQVRSFRAKDFERLKRTLWSPGKIRDFSPHDERLQSGYQLMKKIAREHPDPGLRKQAWAEVARVRNTGKVKSPLEMKKVGETLQKRFARRLARKIKDAELGKIDDPLKTKLLTLRDYLKLQQARVTGWGIVDKEKLKEKLERLVQDKHIRATFKELKTGLATPEEAKRWSRSQLNYLRSSELQERLKRLSPEKRRAVLARQIALLGAIDPTLVEKGIHAFTEGIMLHAGGKQLRANPDKFLKAAGIDGEQARQVRQMLRDGVSMNTVMAYVRKKLGKHTVKNLADNVMDEGAKLTTKSTAETSAGILSKVNNGLTLLSAGRSIELIKGVLGGHLSLVGNLINTIHQFKKGDQALGFLGVVDSLNDMVGIGASIGENLTRHGSRAARFLARATIAVSILTELGVLMVKRERMSRLAKEHGVHVE